MANTISLKQLSQKKYDLLEGLEPSIAQCVGVVEDAFDCIIYGASGNGKSNFTAMFIIALLKALPDAKCEYVAYEEGHAATVKETFIHRHKMLEQLGNAMLISQHFTYEQLAARMARKKSAKIWVIDSIQASGLTQKQCADLKEKFVLSRKKKILIYVSWSDGKKPHGGIAKAVEYYANIKLRVEGLIVFPKTRYEKNGIGNSKFLIHEKGARNYWGEDFEKVMYGKKKPPPKKPAKAKAAPPPEAAPEAVTQLSFLPEAEKPIFKEPLNEIE